MHPNLLHPIGALRVRWDRGLTLLELLVALAIGGLLLAALYGSFSRTLKSKGQAADASALSRRARSILWRMGQDLQGTLHLLSKDQKRKGLPQDTLHLFSLTHQPLGSQRQVMDQGWIDYFMERSPTHPQRQRLMRRVRRMPEAGGEAFPILEDAEGVEFRFFDGKEWQEIWEGDLKRLPWAVEMVLYLKDTQGRIKKFATMIDLPLAHTQVRHAP